jgi:dTDP-4-amino-4,6-dideoxygalactose transaminase
MQQLNSKLTTNRMNIPMSSPDLNEADRQAVLDVLRTSELSQGDKTAAFEQAFVSFTGAKHAIAVNSGTAGLHLCIRAAGITTGDLVITTPFSFVASSNVLLYENAIPVFVDIEKDTGNLDPTLLEEAIHDLMEVGKKVRRWLPRKGAEHRRVLKALLPVDVFGQPVDYDVIQGLARANELTIIEDSCEALGSTYKHKPAGTFGEFGVFAFYPNKQITTGEGGVIITSRDDLADFIRALRNQGRAPGDTWLQHTYLGYNYRIDEMSAALGAAQMLRLDELVDNRKKVAAWYTERLSRIERVRPPFVSPDTTRMSWFVYVVQLDPAVDRDTLARNLEGRGVPVRPYFLPIHLQPYMVERFGYQEGDFPNAEAAGRCGLALPFSGIMTELQVDYVCTVIQEELRDFH